jgi:hypothetical protein
MVEVFKKGFVTGFDMLCGVIAASCSVLCLYLSALGFYVGLMKGTEDEINSLYMLVALVGIPPALLFGYWANGESWIFVLLTCGGGAWIFYIRSILAREDGK